MGLYRRVTLTAAQLRRSLDRPRPMKPVTSRFRAPDPLLVVIVALLCASVLVMYLQRRALADLDRQRAVILRSFAKQRAMSTAAAIRRAFDGPVQDVLLSINPPLLAAERLDLVAQSFARGLREYPQVDRFFVWSEGTQRTSPGEVLFFGGREPKPSPEASPEQSVRHLYRDPLPGQEILARAKRHALSKRIYAAFPIQVAHARFEVFLRIFYTDAERSEYFAVRGFSVNMDALRSHILPALYQQRLASLLEPEAGQPRFDLHILDESGQQVFGPATEIHPLAASEPFLMQFYPVEDIGSRMNATIPLRSWRLVVSPRSDSAGTIASAWMQGYWFSGLSVVLMLVALAFAVQSRRRAVQLSRMQADFVAQVSHQLKTPVALLSAVGETLALQRAQSPEKLAQCVDIVQEESSRLTALIERVLEFSRTGDGGKKYEMEPVNLGTLVRETVDAFSGALESSGFRIEVLEQAAAPTVSADPAALEQVLINLLDNAIKYSGSSRLVTVTVGVSANQAVIAVTDRGIGISADQRRRIFERFYRGDGGILRRQGFGLGLAIAQEVTAAHGGRIEVESTVGQGSTFRVRLPASHAAARHGRQAPQPTGQLA
jgi:signal transduction histidine kinase